jgi:hypothetical protein
MQEQRKKAVNCIGMFLFMSTNVNRNHGHVMGTGKENDMTVVRHAVSFSAQP